jgi:hypothetical protein
MGKHHLNSGIQQTWVTKLIESPPLVALAVRPTLWI